MKSNTHNFAKEELDIVLATPDPILAPFVPEILALCEKFGQSGQSGGSAHYTAAAIAEAVHKLLLQHPISPITGHDQEWVDVGNDMLQNRRCFALFKSKSDGKCYYLDAIVWVDPEGNQWNGRRISSGTEYQSRQYVKEFPWVPKTFYVECDADETITDTLELAKALDYYQLYPV